jgi:hypothetical protein
MPGPEYINRYQKAVLWPVTGTDAYGQPAVGNPIELLVRWDQSTVQQSQSQSSDERVDATAVVDRVVHEGSRMWLGALEDLPGYPLSPTFPVSGLMEVVKYTGVKDIKGRATAHGVSLMRVRR